MDPNRFDSFAKKLGSRLSRRDMMRAGAATAVGAIAVSKFASVAAQDADTTAKDRFIAVRTYAYTGTEADAATGLSGLIPVMEQQPGFVEYNLVFGDGQILAISTFLDETTAVAAAQQENAWITANAANILSGTPTIQSGDVFLRSELHAGCGCITGTQDPCSSDRLTCCATTDRMGGPGICLTTETTCPGAMPAEPTATSAPAEPTAVPPTAVPACTGEGCDCQGGVDGACDDGLVCCGASEPGGDGTCQTEAECNPPCTSEGCTCTSGTDGACDDGLCCNGADTPGGDGTCGDCACTGDGCQCTTGVDGNCDDGLVCCAADMTDPGSPGTCMASCDSSDCNGQENCPCTSGTEDACNDGLECCGADTPGGEGTCQSSC